MFGDDLQSDQLHVPVPFFMQTLLSKGQVSSFITRIDYMKVIVCYLLGSQKIPFAKQEEKS